MTRKRTIAQVLSETAQKNLDSFVSLAKRYGFSVRRRVSDYKIMDPQNHVFLSYYCRDVENARVDMRQLENMLKYAASHGSSQTEQEKPVDQKTKHPIDKVGLAWLSMTKTEQKVYRRRASRAKVSIYELVAYDLAKERKRKKKEQSQGAEQ